MLNTDVNICNVCRCTMHGNEPANTRDDNKCTEEACAEALQNYEAQQDIMKEVSK